MNHEKSGHPTPTAIRPFSATEIFLKFSNGEQYTVSNKELRFLCPCAGCVDEHTGERKITKGQIKPDIKPTAVSQVGQYAFQITWTDRHSTGIYHFDRLHRICVASGTKVE